METEELKYSSRVREVITKAEEYAEQYGEKFVGTEHLLYAMLATPDCVATQLLLNNYVDTKKLMADVSALVKGI